VTGKSQSSSAPQVIFNGKVVTPQSLLYRKPPPPQTNTWGKRLKPEGGVSTIDEVVSDILPEKSLTAKLKRYVYNTCA
jgi:hypothetical protein